MAGKGSSNGNWEDSFAKWLAKLIEDAHTKTEKAFREVIQQEAKATRFLLNSIHKDNHELMDKFHDQSERHHKENMQMQSLYRQDLREIREDSKEMRKEHKEQMKKFQEILQSFLKPGKN